MELTILQNKIYEIRGHRVMLDYDLAALYETETKRLKEAVKRNIKRFPTDFLFELTREEYNFLRSQFASLEKGKGKYSKYLPFAFTEQGVAMLSAVLNSQKAIDVSVSIMRAFVAIRQLAITNIEIKNAIEILTKQTDNNTKNIELVFQYLDELMEKKENPIPKTRVGNKHYD